MSYMNKNTPMDCEGASDAFSELFMDESSLGDPLQQSVNSCSEMPSDYRDIREDANQCSPTAAPRVGSGPNEAKIQQILRRTKYTLDVTAGQRKYGGPPPNWDGKPPCTGCEIFCGKIPKTIFEDELIPLFEACGPIWDLRLMMDPLTGLNRGYAFVRFTTREGAQMAVQSLDNYEIKPGKTLKVNISVSNLRLFVGNIPKSKSKMEIFEEFSKLTSDLTNVIIYSYPDDKKKNRGFCFLQYESHKAASLAKRRLGAGRTKVWGCDIIVDWADPQEEPDEQTMSKVKVLYVRNLTQDVLEETLQSEFEVYGKIEHVKKIKDYAFVHFYHREDAVKALTALDGKEIGGSNIEVSLAKPPSDKKKKEEILRAREKRMMQTMQVRGSVSASNNGPLREQTASSLRGSTNFDQDQDCYSYGEQRNSYNDPYYEEYYRYDDCHYEFPATQTQPRGKGRQSQAATRGRGSTRGRASESASRGGITRGGTARGVANRTARGESTVVRGSSCNSGRGATRVKGNCPIIRRKLDEDQKVESKYDYQANSDDQQPLEPDFNAECEPWYDEAHESCK